MFWCKTILILFCRKAAELKNLLSVRAGSMSDAALRLTDTASIILCLDMAGMLLSQPVNKVRTSTETETGKDNHFFLFIFFLLSFCCSLVLFCWRTVFLFCFPHGPRCLPSRTCKRAGCFLFALFYDRQCNIPCHSYSSVLAVSFKLFT